MSEERNMDELTVSQLSREYHIARPTVNAWIYNAQVPARKALSDLGTEYYVVRRGDFEQFLQQRSRKGRPLKRTP